ncbi:MAG: malto-oligosyltrehalose synthase, partial [Acidobacteria bacterium]|nr:malto-oligosyltrehalose synthase [Acidobacteriota bacterium]
LEDQYGTVLERGELQLAFRDGLLVVRYAGQELPINPREAPRVYRRALERLTEQLGADNVQLHELHSIIASLQNMPPYQEQTPAGVAERHREKEVARSRLARLVSEAPIVGEQIDQAIREFNGCPGQPNSFDALHDLLEVQAYRLAHWRTALHEINYRRFFDVNSLAGLCVENPEVFEATHRLLSDLLREGRVTGVRVDHPDGLFDPADYFDRLQDLAARAWGLETDGQPGGRPARSLYVVAEKILSGREPLPAKWSVHGTTGYNYLNDLNGVFIDGSQSKRLQRVYTKLTGCDDAFDNVLYASKRLIMDTALASELSVLAHMLDQVGEVNRKSRDFTLDSMRTVITEVVACFPVYRTYVDTAGWTPEDRAVVEQAIGRARRRNPAMERLLFDFFREVVLPRDVEDTVDPRRQERRGGYPPAGAEEARQRRRFAMKLQQYTGPVQAKGLEDTAFYRYNLLLSLNEVGGDPSRFGRSVQDFHDANAIRLRDWSFEMIATSTHDTKLGEDTRARINALSELPDEWGREAARWMRINRTHHTVVQGEPAPDRNDEYRFYQALAAVWPPDVTNVGGLPADLIARLQGYMVKAAREAKVHTSWLTTNHEYEDAVTGFVEKVLSGPGGARFLPSFLPFQRRIARVGLINSLAQGTLKLGSPGVPDFYQGTDLWDLTLVDPDNRRPVDYLARMSMLDEIDRARQQRTCGAEYSQALLQNWSDGRIKLLLTAVGLRLRREHPDLFLEGSYVPLRTESTVAADLIAFARTSADRVALFIAPRLCARLLDERRPLPLGGECWKTSRIMLPRELAGRVLRDVVTGAEIKPTHSHDAAWIFAGEAFATLPFAILVG